MYIYNNHKNKLSIKSMFLKKQFYLIQSTKTQGTPKP